MGRWILQTIEASGYFGLVLLMFAENVFPPIPSEFIMPLAGYMALRGELTMFGVIVAGVVGSVLGALPLYGLGRLMGRRRLYALADKHGKWLAVSRQELEHASGWFSRHGGKAVFLGRLVPGVRSLISIPAGVEKMPILPFLAYTTVGSAIWTSFLAGAGYYLGARFTRVEDYLNPVSTAVMAFIVIAYLYRLIRQWRADKLRVADTSGD